MDTSPGCPSDDDVARFVDGKLPAEERSQLQSHIDRCDACRVLVAEAADARLRDRTARDNPDSLGPARLPPLKKGTEVGRYIVLEYLGAGGMATVYAAFDPVLDRRVALKLLNREAHAREGADFLLREARLVARFAHPNVITVHDTGTFGEQLFLAMELVTGGTLRQWLDAPRSQSEILAMLVEAGRGLAAAHDAGLVHRAGKRDNVLLGGVGRPRVRDWGRAGPCGPRPSSGGTPAYMAPEQIDGQRADARTDIFSFCVTLYEALYQQRPFDGETLSQLKSAIADGKVREPPRDRKVSTGLHGLILAGLAADPATRPASLRSLLDRLAVRPWRRRLIWAGVGIALLGGLVSIVGDRVLTARAHVCSGAAQLLDGTWSNTLREKMRARFAQSGLAWAATSFATTSAGLDSYARRWTEAYVSACEETRVRKRHPARTWASTANCLDTRRREMAALVDLLVNADRDTVAHAASAVDKLHEVGLCTGVDREEWLPKDPVVRARLDEAVGQVDRVVALLDLGKGGEGRALVEAAAHALRGLGDPLDEAYADTVLSTTLAQIGDMPGAVDACWAGLEAAQGWGDNGQILESLKALIQLEAMYLGQPELALRLSRVALALIARSGNSVDDIVDVKYGRFTALLAVGQYEEAFTDLREVVAYIDKRFGASSVLGYETRSNLAIAEFSIGRVEESCAEFARAREGLERLLGVGHPDTLIARSNLGNMLTVLGRIDEAAPLLESTLQAERAAFGPQSVSTALAMGNLAEVRLAQHRFAEAAELEQQAITVLEKSVGRDAITLAEPLTQLGLAQTQLGHADAAVPIIERALAISTANGASATDLARVQLSLATALRAGKRDAARSRKLAATAQKAWLDADQKWGGLNRRFADECAPYL